MNKPVLDKIGRTALECGDGQPEDFGNWRLSRDGDGIAWAILDCTDASTNTVSEPVMLDLARLLDALEADPPKALVLRSAKLNGFAAGADISQFRESRDPETAAAWLRRGHDLVDRLEKLPFPTIAVVHGFALGAGFELALACDYRIAVTGASFGFPEVRLGLYPGLGGTFRLPRLIDPTEAMTMMLTGKTAHTRKAKQSGIADAVVEERHVLAAVRDFAGKGKRSSSAGFKRAIFDLSFSRQFAASQMRNRTREKAPEEFYPAPYALIDLWERHGGDRKAMQRAEIESFARLLATPTAQNLIRVFFLREKLKHTGAGDSGINKVHVVGAGTMGAEIAAWCAIKGMQVTLSDVKLPPIAKAIKEAVKTAADAHLSNVEARDALDRLMPDPKEHGIRDADLIIEAAPEKLELKRELLASIEKRARAGAIIATNTSSLELENLAGTFQSPWRFAGLHFFNPVSKLDLVEVVRHDAASEETLSRLENFIGNIAHLPVRVRSYPGFLVNRILTPYLLEAALMVDEGMPAELVDRAAEKFGMPMGPLEVADRVGLDICLHVADSLRQNLARPMPDVPEWMRKRVESGDLGAKSGRGIYSWSDGRPKKSKTEGAVTAEMQDRLILPMLDAAAECHRENVATDPDAIDAAMIFATGFAPFRGGPLHYARERGIDNVVLRLEELTKRHGDRFRPDEGWNALG